ncbi:MAG: TetR family transcriptional regulator [Desulfobacterales bacterium]
MKEKEYIKISELVKRSGLTRSTIHFYLRKGLLHPPMKTGQTMAYYDETHLTRLRTIQKMKMDMRMPIDFIRKQITAFEESEYQKVTEPFPPEKVSETPLPPKDRRKAEIIRAAIQVFSQNGYHRTKISDITGALGISTGTFYIYFTNKRELFIEVIDDVFKNIVGQAARAIKDEGDFVKRLQIRGRVFYENYIRYNEILNQLRAEMASDDEWPHEKIQKIYHGLTRPVIREIEEAVKQGIIRKIDPDLLAYALTGLIEIMSLRVSLDRKYSYDDITGFIADLITSRLTPDP